MSVERDNSEGRGHGADRHVEGVERDMYEEMKASLSKSRPQQLQAEAFERIFKNLKGVGQVKKQTY